MFYALYVRKKFFHRNFRGDSPEKLFSGKFLLPPPPTLANIFGENKKKNWEKYGKIGKNMEKLEIKYGKIGKNMEKLQKYGTVVILARK
jgi:hypothetical protein